MYATSHALSKHLGRHACPAVLRCAYEAGSHARACSKQNLLGCDSRARMLSVLQCSVGMQKRRSKEVLLLEDLVANGEPHLVFGRSPAVFATKTDAIKMRMFYCWRITVLLLSHARSHYLPHRSCPLRG